MPLPVYLFSGFLEAGKTRFIQETLQDPQFNTGEKTLLVVCEEGIEEYRPEKFSAGNVTVLALEGQNELTAEKLSEPCRRNRFDRVLIEYNGMWPLQLLFENMPKSWQIYQHMCFVDASTFPQYFANLRQHMVERFQDADMVVFNRCPKQTDKLPMHRAVKMVNRRAEIAYEYPDGEAEYDDIKDPLPFDLNAPVVEIADADFGLFYMDILDDPDKYTGKTLHFKAMVCLTDRAPKGCFAPGRFGMTCCIEDVAFVGLLCRYDGMQNLQQRQWIDLTARAGIIEHKIYEGKGPLLTALSVEKADPPAEELVYFV
ncbi:MAG: GTP-binding protein [Oscillospiraceae bacterium]|nr:GTP-binding protein [Oscillospiraceae bacterium]